MSKDKFIASPEPNQGENQPILSPPEQHEPQDRATRIRIKNRRKMYLERHPAYFASPELELADPLLYDRCIRRFLSAAEREADGKNKGYSGVLEADLYRSEAKLAAISSVPFASSSSSSRATVENGVSVSTTYVRSSTGEVLPEDPDEIPSSKEEGMERWKYEMEMRFLRGEDRDFDYGIVDGDEQPDAIEEREEEERWFDEQSPGWIEGSGEAETGIQDF